MIALRGYELQHELHQGLISLVYRGVRVSDGLRVIVKILRNDYPTENELRRYQREYSIASALVTPAVVRPLALERANHRLALIYEDTGSMSLRHVFRGNALPLGRWLEIAIAITDTLHDLHSHGVIHKDLNPTNMVLEANGQVRFIDFEMATAPGQRSDDEPSDVVGTYAYLAPEQSGRTRSQVDTRSDLYALGATLFELATSQSVFTETEPAALIHAHLALVPRSPHTINPAIGETISAIILKLLAKSPADRYQTAGGLLADLKRAQQDWLTHRKVLPFALAAHDFSAEIRFADELYGRAAQHDSLADAFNSARHAPKPAWVSLTGAAGSGKTSVVLRFAGRLPNRHLLCAGRCDRLQTGVPFAGIASAFGPLMRQWLSRDGEALAALRRRLTTALGANAGVVAQLIPDFERVIGKSLPPLPLGASAAQTRFQLSFRAFMTVAAEDQSPLVLFLDDVQWADSASLQFFDQLLTGSPVPSVLLITAEREGEASPTLAAWRSKLIEKNVPEQRLSFSPLRAADVEQLLAESLTPFAGGAPGLAVFAQAVLRKTLGNPFFVRQFVQSLASSGLLRYSEGSGERGEWCVEIAAIEQIKLSDGILSLLTDRIARLDAPAQRALRMAACIGQVFDGDTVAAIGDSSTTAGLDELRRNGLLHLGEPNARGTPRYLFVHESIRELALSELASHEREQTHWRIGHRLLEQMGSAEADYNLFDAVNQLNRGMSCANDDAARWQLLDLNERAARDARNQATYDASLEYASYAVSLLPADGWDRHYARALNLSLLLADAQASAGQLDAAVQVFQYCLDQAHGAFDQATCLDRLSDALQSSGNAAAALVEVRRALALLGQPLDLDSPNVATEQSDLVEALADESVFPRFANLRSVEGEAALVSSLYDKAIISVYFSAPQHLALVAARSTKHVLDTGFTPQSSIALGWWSMILCMLNRHPQAFVYATFARDTGARFESDAYRGASLMLAHAMTLCWQWSYAENAKAASESYERCHRSGNLQFASYGLIVEHISACVEAASVTAMLESCERWRDYCERYVPLELGQAKIRVHYLKRLMGQPASTGNTSEALDVEAILTAYQASGNGTDVCESLVEMARVELLFDRFDLALAHAERAAPFFAAGAAGTLLLNLQHHVVLAVASARVAGSTPEGAERDRLIAQLQLSAAAVQNLAQYSDENFFGYRQLVVAEQARLDNNLDLALGAYLRGAAHATTRGYWLLKAQLLQYSGELIDKIGLGFGSSIMAESQMYFRRAGAHAKFSQRLSAASSSIVERSGTARASNVEMSAVVKASDLLVSELDLARLPTRLLTLVMENTGAQRGVLALNRPEGLALVADATEGAMSTPLSSEAAAPLCPASLIGYVARALLPVVLDDGAVASTFANDPYFQSRRVRSVLCAPILRHGQLRGVVYVENNAVAGVFTDSRLSVVSMLCGSAAVALENAELYQAQKRYAEELEQRVAERTLRLEAANTELARLANLDGLTQVANRRRFDTVLAQRLASAQQVWLVLCDVDDFKRYNDHYGHQAGDDALRRVALALAQSVMHPNALVARYGGEEFVIVLADVDAEAARGMAEAAGRAVAALNIEHRFARAVQRISLSIGLSGAVAPHSETAESLIRRADTALYAAKAAGRNRLMLSHG